MMVLKCFNLPFSPPLHKGSAKAMVWWKGKGICVEGVLWETPLCRIWKSASQFTGPHKQLRSICEHIKYTPAIQFGIVGIAAMNQQVWHYLAEIARPQSWDKTAGGTSQNTRRSSQLCLSQRIKDQQRSAKTGRPTSIEELAL